jgi:hypothetical protein
MKKAIIHISDLHVMSAFNDDNEPEKVIDSWLNCKDRVSTDRFVDLFTDSVLRYYKDYILYMVISGDLTNKSRQDEFKELTRVLDRIIKNLKLDKKNILIIPGDHDVNRFQAKLAAENDNNSKPVFEYYSEKFKYFTEFYDDFFKPISKQFSPDRALVDILEFKDEKILYVGFNSNFKIGAITNPGFIDIEVFEKDLEELELSYSDYNKIALFHHNFLAFYKEEDDGQWEKNNAEQVIRLLDLKKYKCYIYGNEHTPSSKIENSIPNISIGSLSKNDKTHYSYNVLSIEKNESELTNNFFVTTDFKIKKVPEFGQWSINDNKGEVKSVKLIVPLKHEQFQNIVETPTQDNSSKFDKANKKIEEVRLIETPEHYKLFSEDNEDHKTLLKLIKQKNLFHSGHFHWSKTSRAHNWIDISKLLANKKDLLDTKNHIINIIEENKLSFDFIIGLGIEGNMLATRTSIVYDKDYTFLPYSYRYEDHSTYEQKFNFDYDEKYKTVLIITDVVHDGRTIRKLIHKEGRGKDFFEKVKKIIVVALFYTGELVKEKRNDFNLLNRKLEDDKFDIENDHPEVRIQFHFVSHIRVEECPYTKDNFETDCIIVREKLGCIHKFYSGN